MDVLARVVTAILFATLLGCGKKPVTNAESDLSVTPRLSESESNKRFFEETEQIRLNCSEQSCPEGVFLVRARNFSSAVPHTCTGLLVGENEILVPSSCLPSRYLKDGRSCGGAVLARDYLSDQVYECDIVKSVKLEKYDEKFPETWRQDYVVLQFQKLPSRENFVIPLKSGLYENRQYDLWSYHFDLSQRLATLQSKTCMVQYKNYVQPLGLDTYSPSLSLSACKGGVTESDLGGVLFRERTFGRFRALAMINSFPVFNPSQIKRDENFDGAALIQNFTCFEYRSTELRKDVPSSCLLKLTYDRVENSRYEQLLLNKDSEELAVKVDAIKRLYATGDLYIEWDVFLESTPSELILSPVPKCFHNLEKWLIKSELRRRGQLAELTYDEDLVWTEYKISPYLSFNGNVFHQLENNENYSFRLTIYPRKLNRTGKSEVLGFLGRSLELAVCN